MALVGILLVLGAIGGGFTMAGGVEAALADIEEAGVLHAVRDLPLREEAIDDVGVGRMAAIEELDRDALAGAAILGEEDVAHPTARELRDRTVLAVLANLARDPADGLGDI